MEEQNKNIPDQKSEIEKTEEIKKEIPKKTIIIGTIIAVVAIIAIVCIILLGGKNAPNGSTPSGDNPSTENHTSYDAFNFHPQDDGTYIVAVGNGKYLSEIVIPSTYNGGKVVGIAKEGFKDCENLKSIVIPDSVTSIGDNAFENCAILTNITLPNSNLKIGQKAFLKCTSLTNISIPSKVIEIGEGAFYGCDKLENVYIEDLRAWMLIKFESGSSNPLDYAENLYLNNELLTEIAIPDNIEKIGDHAFRNYSHIKEVYIPDNIIYIGNGAFSSCENLESVIIGSSVKEIGEYAFYYCKKLSNCEMGENVERIEMCAFQYCPIDTLVIPESFTYIGIENYMTVKNLHLSDINVWFDCFVDSRAGVQCENLYIDNQLVTEIVIPDGITRISSKYIPGAINITHITIPTSVTHIEIYTFTECNNLTDVYYLGTKEQRLKININSGDYSGNGNNDNLLNATWHYAE